MRTYKAGIHNNRVERLERPPDKPDAPSNQERMMAEVLEELAHRDTFAEIGDPVAWQRDLRSERVLPDREA